MKNKSGKFKYPSPERLKRLKELSERLRGSLPNFMTQEDLRKMRNKRKSSVGAKSL
jgi:hypothetical protein